MRDDVCRRRDSDLSWATLDMVPLFLESFVDSQGKPCARICKLMPRIYQQVDFSNGGDRSWCAKASRPPPTRAARRWFWRKISFALFSLNMLVSGGVQLPEVQMIFTEDALSRRRRHSIRRKRLPPATQRLDIYNLSKIKGNRLLVTTQDANSADRRRLVRPC